MTNMQNIINDLDLIKDRIRKENEPSQFRLISIVINSCLNSNNPEATREYLKNIGAKNDLMNLADKLLQNFQNTK